MSIGGVVINFMAKTAEAVSDSKKLSRAVDDVGDSGKKAGGKGGLGGLVSSMGAALPVIGAVVIGAAGAAAALFEMSKGALEDKQQADKLADTLSRIPGVTQKMIDANADWVDSMQLATLVSDTDLRAAISKLTLATGDLEEAQKLAALSADVAAGSGKSYATITDALTKAVGGQTTALKRQFPFLDANKDGTVTLTEATKGLEKAFGGAAAAAAKNDPFKRIGIIFDELKESIGNALVPVLEKVSDWFASPKNQQKIKDLLNKVSDLATAVGEDLKDALVDLVAWLRQPENQQKLKDWAKAAGDTAKAFVAIVSAIKDVIAWLGRIPKPPSWLKPFTGLAGLNPFSAPPPAAPGVAARASAPTPAPAPAVVVTEEQIYRAISRLVLRGEARNGRLVVVG